MTDTDTLGAGMPGESFHRLVYERLDPAHTPPLGTTDVDLDELRARSPGSDNCTSGREP